MKEKKIHVCENCFRAASGFSLLSSLRKLLVVSFLLTLNRRARGGAGGENHQARCDLQRRTPTTSRGVKSWPELRCLWLRKTLRQRRVCRSCDAEECCHIYRMIRALTQVWRHSQRGVDDKAALGLAPRLTVNYKQTPYDDQNSKRSSGGGAKSVALRAFLLSSTFAQMLQRPPASTSGLPSCAQYAELQSIFLAFSSWLSAIWF